MKDITFLHIHIAKIYQHKKIVLLSKNESKSMVCHNSLVWDMNVTQPTVLQSEYYGFLRINYAVIGRLICCD